MIILATTKNIYLGNKLFLYSHFIAWAKEYNKKIYNPAFGPYAHIFDTTENDFYCRFPVQESFMKTNAFLRKIHYDIVYFIARFIVKFNLGNKYIDVLDIGWDTQCILESKEFMDLINSRKILFLQGWQYRTSLKEKYAEEIKKYFIPKEHHILQVKKLIEIAKKDIDVLIGIHIRQGDYFQLRNDDFYETDEYIDVMKKVAKLFSSQKIRFLICSNVPQDENKFEGFDFIFSNGAPIEDMFALGNCNYIVGPPSTFSAWASYYNNTPLYFIHDIKEEIKIENFEVRDI